MIISIHKKIYLSSLLFLLSTHIYAQNKIERKSLNHDSTCFTQGLIVQNNIVWESCGGYGQSRVINWNLQSGEVINETKINDKYFVEGLTELNGKLFMLTWKSQAAFEIDKETLKIIKSHKYFGQGWGLTTDGEYLIMSNGSNILQFINPETFKSVKGIEVKLGNTPVYSLNELEWIDGKIWANVFQTDYIVVIDPETGSVTQRFSLPNLLKEKNIKKPGVLNGIAHDIQSGKTWITGKNWPLIFEL